MKREFSAGGVLVRRDAGPLVTWRRSGPQGKPRRGLGAAEGALDAGERPRGDGRPRGATRRPASGAARREARRRALHLHAGTASGSSRSSPSFCCAPGAAGSATSPEDGIEVAEARWLPLDEAPRLLAYGGEREMAEGALQALPRTASDRCRRWRCSRSTSTRRWSPTSCGRSRKTATIRLGDKSAKYKKGMIVTVLVGARYGQREKVFDAVIDKVEVKRSATSRPARSSTTTPRSAAPTSSRSGSRSSTTARSPRTTPSRSSGSARSSAPCF